MNDDIPYMPGYRRPSQGRVILFSMFTSAIVSASTTVAVLRWGPPALRDAEVAAPRDPQQATEVQVPQVTSLRLGQADSLLASHGLRMVVAERQDAMAPAETVIAQNPLHGSRITAGEAVSVVVSNGLKLVATPELAGHTVEEAELALRVLGLEVGELSEVAEGEPGQIVRQNPPGGARVAVGSSVALVVGVEARVTVPDLTGLKINRAREQLETLGFVISSVRERYDRRRRGNVVLEQTPEANADVPAGSEVSLVINQGD